jgi:type IV pilus assembly protein PilQ
MKDVVVMKMKKKLAGGSFTARISLFTLAILLSVLPKSFALQAQESKSQKALKIPVTYICTDKPIGEVLITLAEQAGIDIVKSPLVTGNVTVKLTAVPLEEALDNILTSNNYTYVATENMIRVVSVPEILALEEKYVTRVYKLTYSDVNDVAAALDKFVSGKGKVAFNKATSHIMVTDTPDRISGIDKFIEQIDQKTQQVLVEVRIYDVTANEGFDLSPQWFLGTNSPLETTTNNKTSTRTRVSTEAPSSLLRTHNTTTNTEGQEASADQAFKLNPGEILQIVPDELRTFSNETIENETENQQILNPDGYNSNKKVNTSKTTSTKMKRDPFVSGSFDRTTGGTLNFGILNNSIDLEFALSVLKTQVESKLLANPRVLVLDNESANFEIVREIPYRELMQVSRQNPITYTAFKNVGVHLKVTPHIARDGVIKLRISPEFGVLVGQDADAAPIVDSRRADTVALIDDGQTIVIGGLRQKMISKDVSKVPILADLPFIGGIFKGETEAVKNNELVIFISAKIVNKPQLSGPEAKTLDATEILPPTISKTWLEKQKDKELAAQKPSDSNEISDILQKLLKSKE